MSKRSRRQAEAIIERYDHETQDILRHTRIDHAAFAALAPAEKAARWQLFDQAAREDLVRQELTRLGRDWTDDLIVKGVAQLNARWGSQPASELALPSAAAIADDAAEQATLARQHGDERGAAQLDRVALNVLSGVRMAWHGGELLIASLNTPGAVYRVSRAGCSCPNGRAGKAGCWHVALYDRLLDMLDHRAMLADEAAEVAAEAEPPAPSPAELGRRLASARARYQEAA
jgi:hypothetical protein